jgi:hypothetical protein
VVLLAAQSEGIDVGQFGYDAFIALYPPAYATYGISHTRNYGQYY